MELQLSSGSGPAECELAVAKLLQALMAEFPGIEVLQKAPGQKAGCYRSVRIACKNDLSFLEGSVKWVCQSPYRPKHKRKNWFVDVSICQTATQTAYSESDVRFETFRSGGKGGQHVNKVETGVRAVHYRPFTLEGNMCAADVLQEMFLYSEKNAIRLFPAVPSRFEEVAFENFRAPHGIFLSAKMNTGVITSATIHATQPCEVILKSGAALLPEYSGRPCTVSPAEGEDLHLVFQ